MLKKSNIIRLIFIGICLLPGSLMATKKPSLSLKEAVLLGARMNLSIRSATLQRVIDKFALAEAQNQFVPQYNIDGSSTFTDSVSGGGPHTRNFATSLAPQATLTSKLGTTYSVVLDNTYTNRDDSPDSYNPGVTVKVSQPLLRGAGRKMTTANLSIAEAQALSNRLTFKNTIISQVNTIINDYLTLIKSNRNIAIQQQAVQHSLDNLNAFQSKIKAGVSAPADLADIQTSLYQNKLSMVTAENTAASNQQTLLTDLGLDPNASLSILDKVDISHYKIPEIEKAYAVALKNNIAYQQALIQLAINKTGLFQKKNDALWKLDLSAEARFGHGASNGNDAGWESVANSSNTSKEVGLNLAIPIDNFSIKQGIADAKITLQKQEISLKQSRWALKTKIINAIHSLEADKQQISLAEHRLTYAKKSYHVTQEKIAVGRSTTFELTSKASDLTQANLTLVSNQIGFIIDFANLDALLGTTLKTWDLSFIY